MKMALRKVYYSYYCAALVVVLAGRFASAGQTYRPQDFGARGDGAANDTLAVQAAFSACESSSEACSVVIDDGVFLTGPLTLSSNFVLKLGAKGTLKAYSLQPWSDAGWNASEAFIGGKNLVNVSIFGPGIVDGSGKEWWIDSKDDHHYRPHLLKVHNISNFVIDGLHAQNSPNHHMYIEDCASVRVSNLNVTAPADSPNTDGINFAGGFDQSIVDSHISNGDDCISVVCGKDDKGGNVLVRNVTCVHGHGISIGSVRHGYVSNVTMRNVTMIESENGPRLKTYPNNTGCISGIVFDDILLQNVQMGILINGNYCPKSQKPYPCPPGNAAVRIEDILFENVRGTVSGKQQRDDVVVVASFNCSQLSPCKNINLKRVQLSTTTPDASNDPKGTPKGTPRGQKQRRPRLRAPTWPRAPPTAIRIPRHHAAFIRKSKI